VGATEELLERVAELGPVFRSRMRDHDADSSFPFDNLKPAQDAGLHALTLPVEYGGAGYWRPGIDSGCYRILEELAGRGGSTPFNDDQLSTDQAPAGG
jgi:alkylation response protein AidB-like acyl-CoA dehydrogenase